jgi:ATP-dependent exoDNAse (exonuclease V) beta subunit
MEIKDLVILEKSFSNVVFIEKNHSYEYEELKTISVTQLLKKYEKPFDVEKISRIVASKKGMLVEDVRSLWDFKREYACIKGTFLHSYIESFLQRKRTQLNKASIFKFVSQYQDYVSVEGFYEDMAKLIANFQEFYKMWKEDYVLVRQELVMGDKETGVCGMVDNLSYNVSSGKLIIFDYKSNHTINREEQSKEYLLGSLSHLKSCEFIKYSLQLWLYATIIERNTPFKVEEVNIVWFGGDEWELIKALDVRKEVEQILKELTEEQIKL